MKTIYCLLFILTNSVMAQASSIHADLGITRVETKSWSATHAGELELDGLRVVAALETVENPLELPRLMAGAQSVVPSLAPKQKSGYRLLVAAVENPSLRARYDLVGRVVSVDGVTRFAYVSQDPTHEFQFLILAQEDGSLLATFTRKLGQNEVQQGEFTLAPLPQLLQK